MKDNVDATAIQLDHHNKIMSNKSDLTDVLTGMSESGAIKAKGNMSSSSYSDKATKLMLNNMPRKEMIKLATVDNPHRDTPGVKAALPSLYVGMKDAFAFAGEIVYVKADAELQGAIDRLQSSIPKDIGMPNDRIGMDIEWITTKAAGSRANSPAVMQLSTDTVAIVVHLRHLSGWKANRMVQDQKKNRERKMTTAQCGDFPTILFEFLTDKQLIGFNISGDVTVLKNSFPRSPWGSLHYGEVSTKATKQLFRSRPLSGTYGLEDFVHECFAQPLDKELRLSSWEAVELSVPQQLYAATDAWAALRLYRHLEERASAVAEMVIGAPVSSRGDIAQDEEILEEDCLAELADDTPGDEDADLENRINLSDYKSFKSSLVLGASYTIIELAREGKKFKYAHEFPEFLSAEIRGELMTVAEAVGLSPVSHKQADGKVTLRVSGPSMQSEVQIDESVRRLHSLGKQASMAFGEILAPGDGMYNSVKYDIRHWMGNFYLMAQSKQSPVYKYFVSAVADAVFKWMPGSLDDIVKHLKALGMDAADIKRVSKQYKRAHGRVHVPDPVRLERDLTAVYHLFRAVICPKSGKLFYQADHVKIFETAIGYVRQGYLSDVPGMNYYVPVGKYSTGLVKYRCLRSTSALEGYHLHLRMLLSPLSKGRAGPRWIDALVLQFDFRWSVKALSSYGSMAHPGHFDFQLKDRLHDVLGHISPELQGVVLPGWKRKQQTPGTQYFGSVFVYQAARMSLPGQEQDIIPPRELSVHASHADWVGNLMGLGPNDPVRTKPTVADVKKMLRLSKDKQSAAEISTAMLQHDRLFYSEGSTKRLIDETVLQQAAAQRVFDAGRSQMAANNSQPVAGLAALSAAPPVDALPALLHGFEVAPIDTNSSAGASVKRRPTATTRPHSVKKPKGQQQRTGRAAGREYTDVERRRLDRKNDLQQAARQKLAAKKAADEKAARDHKAALKRKRNAEKKTSENK